MDEQQRTAARAIGDIAAHLPQPGRGGPPLSASPINRGVKLPLAHRAETVRWICQSPCELSPFEVAYYAAIEREAIAARRASQKLVTVCQRSAG